MSWNEQKDTEYIRGALLSKGLEVAASLLDTNEGSERIILSLLELGPSVIAWLVVLVPWGLINILDSLVKHPHSLAATYAVLLPRRARAISEALHPQQGWKAESFSQAQSAQCSAFEEAPEAS